MTRKHFQAIAKALMSRRITDTTLPGADLINLTIDLCAEALADELANANSLFDRARFLTTCGVEG